MRTTRSRAAGSRTLQLVSMGGGTGLSRLLSGLKDRVVTSESQKATDTTWLISDLTAVVTVSDDGGSSGRLRTEFRMLPPGDIRNCLVALAECEPLLASIFQHRFAGSGQLSGHNFGNLFLAALAGITGDFAQAIHACSQILAIRGKILPATLHDVRLEARCEDGSIISGESSITRSRSRKELVRLVPARCQPLPETIQAIRKADIITLGPGSLLTSVLPNLLVRKTAKEIRKSKAVKIYIANIMTQPGETDGFSASDHIKMINKHVGDGLFDAIIINNRGIGRCMRARYKAQGADLITGDRPGLEKLGLRVYARALASEEEVVRHDAEKLAHAIGEVYRDLRPEGASAR
jgi:uncharacterized cofD-like protein